MNLHQAQSKIASDTHRFRVVNCGRRFGKTTLAVLEMVAKAVYGDNRQICYIAPTYQQARDIAWQELKRLCLPIAHKINESRLEIIVNTIKGGTSIIMLRGWESIETLRGQKFHFIVVDEIASMRNWDTNWQEVIRPTLTDYRGEALFISTPKGFNHFYELYNKQHKDSDYKSFHFSTYDNPHVPFEEIEKAKIELTEDRFAQEYMADFRKTEGLVYKTFDRERHVYTDKIFNPVEVLVPIDWGWTNPAAILKIIKDTDRNYYVTEEWYRTQQTTPQIIEVAKSFGGNKYYPDPAEPDRIEEARRAKLNVREVSKDIEAGISTVQELFKANRLYIHSSCTNLIWELETYSYPEKKPDHNEAELPIKENDHCFIANSLVTTINGEKKIYNIRKGDLVLTSEGYKPVLIKHSNGKKEVSQYWLHTDMGSVKIVCTSDHKIKTGNTWTPISQLKQGMTVYLIKSSRIKSTTYTKGKDITLPQTEECIEKYGNTIMVKFLKDFIFIIKTKMSAIIDSKISSLYQDTYIYQNTQKIELETTENFTSSFKRKVLNPLRNGTNQKKELSGTVSMQKKLGLDEYTNILSAKNVDSNLCLNTQESLSFAITTAKLVHLEKGKSWQEKVYDLTIEDVHEYVVNGVLVHNCMDAMRYALYMNEGKANLGQAHTHYASNTQPRNNNSSFQVQQGLPPELKDKPRTAYTHIPRL